MEHINRNSRVTDPTPDPWALLECQVEGKEQKTKGTLESGVSYKKPLNESQGGRAYATVK